MAGTEVFSLLRVGSNAATRDSKNIAYGIPASTPVLKDMLAGWKAITQAAAPCLEALIVDKLLAIVMKKGKPI